MASSDSGPLTTVHDPSKQAPDTSSGSRYRFRSDLEILHSGDADIADADVTVVDMRSGERHIFTADEFRLCQAADGINTLAAIRQAFNAGTGRDFAHGKLFALFRRLRSLGLLEENAADNPDPLGAAAVSQTPTPVAAESAGTRPSEKSEEPIAVTPDKAEERKNFENVEFLGTPGGGKASGRAARRGVRRRLHGAGRVEETGGGPAADNRAASAEPRGPAAPRQMRDGDPEAIGLGGGALQNFRSRLARRDAEDAPASKEPARLSFFNPNFILGVLAALTWPLKYLVLPLLLVVAGSVWLIYHQREILTEDMRAFDASVVSLIILGLVIANFTSRLTQATLIRGFGGEVREFGITLRFGIPRFFVDLAGISALGRRGQLWAQGMPLIWRLGLFCAGTLLWFLLREGAPALSHLALAVGQIGLLTFLLSAWPLLPSDGYRWLATYLAQPTLRGDTIRAATGRSSDIVDGNKTARGLLSPVTFYVFSVALVGAMVALVSRAYFDVATTSQVGLPTAVLLLTAGIALAVWAVALWSYGLGREIEAFDTNIAQQLRANWPGQNDLASGRPTSLGTVGKVFWAVVAAALLAVAFLPYRYQAAGTFEILPTQRTVVTVRTAGEIDQVAVHEGDLVVANQVLAKLSTKDQQRDVSIASTELQRAKAQLAQFGGDKKTGGEKAAGSDLERSIADAIGDEPDTATARDDVTAANYTKTQAESAARADVERLTRKLAFARDQLADTTVRAPTPGRVMTPNVNLLTGTYLHRGAELLTLEDTHTLQAEISLPEADVGLVKVGDNVRLRPWANEDREIAGKVTNIAPAAQTKSYGTIVRVGASIPNPEDSLRPAMTGYAKIDGEDMRVWEAFLRRTIRIVRVEFWSWIP
jgi:multidrug efflux pump subunit AcrA (membrane-fusion protein)